MTKKKKKKKSKFKKIISDINVPFLIVGLILILFGFINSSDVEENKLQKIDVVLSTNVKPITGTRGLYGYKFWAKNNRAEFVIERGIKIEEDFSNINSLTEGDSISITIDSGIYDLMDKLEQVPIYSLKYKGNIYISIESYKRDDTMYNRRMNVIQLFIGSLFLLNAFTLRLRLSFFLIILFLIAMIIMLTFEFGIYTKT